MKTQIIQQCSGIKYALKRARALRSDDYRYFIKQLDNWTSSELEKIKNKKLVGLEREVAVDIVFLKRDREIEKVQKDLFPKKETIFEKLKKAFGIV